MRKVTKPRGFDTAKVFFSVPLARAREIASRVAAPVVVQAAGVGELLDVRGQEVLRDALAGEFPSLSGDELFNLAGEVAGTANLIATVEWRNAGHSPKRSPAVGQSALEGALLIHLHASPSLCPPSFVSPRGKNMQRSTSIPISGHRTLLRTRCGSGLNWVENINNPCTSIGRHCKPTPEKHSAETSCDPLTNACAATVRLLCAIASVLGKNFVVLDRFRKRKRTILSALRQVFTAPAQVWKEEISPFAKSRPH